MTSPSGTLLRHSKFLPTFITKTFLRFTLNNNLKLPKFHPLAHWLTSRNQFPPHSQFGLSAIEPTSGWARSVPHVIIHKCETTFNDFTAYRRCAVWWIFLQTGTAATVQVCERKPRIPKSSVFCVHSMDMRGVRNRCRPKKGGCRQNPERFDQVISYRK